MATINAFFFKSFSIYRNTIFKSLFGVLWPCLMLALVYYLKEVDQTPNHHEVPPPNGWTTPITPAFPRNDGHSFSSPPPRMSKNSILKTEVDGNGNSKLSPNNHGLSKNKPRYDYLTMEQTNDSESYFTEATFRKKFLDNSLYNDARIRNRRSNDDERIIKENEAEKMFREIEIVKYCVVFIICFMGSWTKSGKLAQAERMSGSVERMRMLGTNDVYIILGYIIHTGLEQIVSSVLFTFLLKTYIIWKPMLENLDNFSIFIMIMLINIQGTIYFLTLASFFDNFIIRSIVGSVSFMYLFTWAVRQNLSVAAQIFANMLPPFCFSLTMRTVYALEESGGMTWNSLVSRNNGINDLPLLVVILLVFISYVLMITVFYYMMNVKPGPFGAARPFYFIFPKSIQKLLPMKINPFTSNIDRDTRNFREGLYEKVPLNMETGIKIENLYKNYGNVASVRNLSLNIYSGQITALLGHNGAGKTTTLSILAGMISPTSGSAYYQHYDIFENPKVFRKNLGLCPQSDLLHPELKVINQLIFFGMLSGLTKNEAETNALKLLKKVGILEKQNASIKQLSGGMKRKLCIALALVGNPKVVILDEPTSGVDPESRREIWNVLLESRNEKIMLITTHFMEEADALGDQIAIMNHGEIVCYGSSLFLKKHYGAGYHLSVSTNPINFGRVLKLFKDEIPETTVISEQDHWIKLKLPFQKAGLFPNLINTLELDNDVLNITISSTTMEDVYLKVEEEVGGEIPTLPKMKRVIGIGEKKSSVDYVNTFLGLLMKNMICTRGKWIFTTLMVVVLPPLVAYFAFNDYNTDFETISPESRNNSFDIILDEPKECHPDTFLFLKTTIFSLWISLIIFIISSMFSTYVHDERVSTVKHLVLMTRTSPITYWISNLLWDSILFSVYTLLTLTTLLIMDTNQLFERTSGVYLFLFILLFSGLSMISSIYFITFLFKTTRSVIIFYYSIVLFIGIVSDSLVQINYFQPYINILKLQPFTATLRTIFKFMYIAGTKQGCRICPSEQCSQILKLSYFDDENLANDLIFLIVDLIFYMVLVILIDYGLFELIWDKISSLWIGRVENSKLIHVDTDVTIEKDRVGVVRDFTDGEKLPIAIIDGLAKKYSSNMTAVYDVTFAVSKGECFGLLGVNGAGKSTTFNMLTGIFYPTEGNVFIKGYSLNNNKSKCLSDIGYCPQHSALINSLTGREMLTLFARLRLIPKQHVESEVDKWISLFGLEEYQNRKCGTYSGGNKRKLNAAMAFVGDPSVILLDEPTTGVDPFIRRNLWSVIHACQSTNQAIIISSHSMDECEAVCDRLTIMVGGRMECIGNIQHLKSLYGKGYVIMIKLKAHDDNEVQQLKNKIDSSFGLCCELKDEHQVLLHYHITSNAYKVSQLFTIMETVKNNLKIVDDYIITNSSLEEVFLSFAKNRK